MNYILILFKLAKRYKRFYLTRWFNLISLLANGSYKEIQVVECEVLCFAAWK